jgi:AcrR family transcriptional regulator
MSPPRSAPDQSRRRQEILAVAEQVFLEKGFANATVRDIAEGAGILSGSLYHHFDSKQTMLWEILGPYLRTIIEQYEQAIAEGGGPAATLERMIDIGCRAIESHQAAIAIFQNDYAYLLQLGDLPIADLGEQVIALWESVLRAGVVQGDFRSDVDVGVTCRIILGTILSIIRWYQKDGPLSIDEVAQQVSQLQLDGVVKR